MDDNSPKGVSATRGKTALTHRGVEGLQGDSSIAYRICDLRCPGLAVRVGKTGLKTWDVAYRVRKGGAYRRLSLGPFPAVTLEDARERAGTLIRAAKAGRDLIGEEQAAKAAADARLTVAQLIELYLSKKVRGHLRSAHVIEQRMARTFRSLKHRCADELRRRDLRELLDAVFERGAPREAEQRRQCMRVLFRWALSQDLIEQDPAAGLTSYGSSPRRERVLASDEIAALWHWLGSQDIPEAYVQALRLQLAIGARISEVGGMRACEIDQQTWVWTLPAERSKNQRARATPLVGLAREIVEARLQSAGEGPLFMIERGEPLNSNHVASMLVKRRRKPMPIARFTSHDLRRTVATGLVDLGFSYEDVAAVLGHEAGSANVRTLVRHYVRSDLVDRKRRALEGWDSHLRLLLKAGEGLRCQ